jgi:hypothetical protein
MHCAPALEEEHIDPIAPHALPRDHLVRGAHRRAADGRRRRSAERPTGGAHTPCG